MKTIKIIKYVIKDISRSKAAFLYLFLLAASSGILIYSTGDSSRATLSMLNIVLLIVPLFTIIYATIHIYSSREMIETMLVFPVTRSHVFASQLAGVSLTLSLCVILGIGLPFILNKITTSSIYLLITSVCLTFIFTSFAFLIASLISDRAKGIGLSLIAWLYFAVIYDMLVIALYMVFSDYPLETATIIMAMLNPVDLARILILLQTDVSVLMGYTGAVLSKFFGSLYGSIFSTGAMLLWFIVPYFLAKRIFNTKDF